MQAHNNIPEILRNTPQWILWGYNNNEKIPVNPNNINTCASISDPTTWADYTTCCEMAARHSLFLGFVFTKNDNFVGIDIDNIDKVSPENKAAAQEWRERLMADEAQTYAELSPSGTGVHLIGYAPDHREMPGRKSSALQIEMYSNGRFFTMTGNAIAGRNQITDVTDMVNNIQAALSRNRDRGGEYETLDRVMGCDDQKVIDFAARRFPSMAKHWHAQGDRSLSDSMYEVLRALDYVTADTDQVWRIFETSGIMAQYETEGRGGKPRRTFEDDVRRAHLDNNATKRVDATQERAWLMSPMFMERAAQMWTRMQAEQQAADQAQIEEQVNFDDAAIRDKDFERFWIFVES